MKRHIARRGTVRRAGVIALAILLWPGISAAGNRLIPFQGSLTDGAGTPVADGAYRVTYVIYDAPTGGNALWTETHDPVSVTGGYLNTLLGAINSLDDPDGNGDEADRVSFDDSLGPRYIGIKVGPDTNQEMVPRQQLVPAFFAREADSARSVGVGVILEGNISDGAVTGGKIASASITAAKLAPASVTSGALGAGAVTASAMGADSVDSANVVNGSIEFEDLAAAVQGLLTPVGTIVAFAGSTAPAGWLICDGAARLRTSYSELFSVLGVTHGEGDGLNTFNIPDYRGRFLRGVDDGAGNDPDSGPGSRIAMNPGGNTGDAVGSVQGDENKAHQHIGGYASKSNSPLGSSFAPRYGETNTTATAKTGFEVGGYFETTGPNTSSTGGAETRPRNAYVNWIIRCGDGDAC